MMALVTIKQQGQPVMSICEKFQIDQYTTWLSSSISSVKLLLRVRNYVMPANEQDNVKADETGFCSKVSSIRSLR